MVAVVPSLQVAVTVPIQALVHSPVHHWLGFMPNATM
jgi:hypothetical protein